MLNTTQIITLVVLMVLLIIRMIPEIQNAIRKHRCKITSVPYCFFELTSEKIYSLSDEKVDSLDVQRQEGTIMCKKYCNRIGLLIFISELDKMIMQMSEGEENLITLAQDVQKSKEEGVLEVHESADDQDS